MKRNFIIFLSMLFFPIIFVLLHFIYDKITSYYGFIEYLSTELIVIGFIILSLYFFVINRLCKNIRNLTVPSAKTIGIGLGAFIGAFICYIIIAFNISAILPGQESLINYYKPFEYIVFPGEEKVIEAPSKHEYLLGRLAIKKCTVAFVIINKIEYIDNKHTREITGKSQDIPINLNGLQQLWGDLLTYKGKLYYSKRYITGKIIIPNVENNFPVKITGYIKSIPVSYPEITIDGNHFINNTNIIDTDPITILIIPKKLKVIFMTEEKVRNGHGNINAFFLFIGGIVYLIFLGKLHFEKI